MWSYMKKKRNHVRNLSKGKGISKIGGVVQDNPFEKGGDEGSVSLINTGKDRDGGDLLWWCSQSEEHPFKGARSSNEKKKNPTLLWHAAVRLVKGESGEKLWCFGEAANPTRRYIDRQSGIWSRWDAVPNQSRRLVRLSHPPTTELKRRQGTTALPENEGRRVRKRGTD